MSFIKFLNNLLPKRIRGNSGFVWWAIPAAIAAGTSIASAARGNRDKVENTWLQNPEYPEAEGARKNWWEILQKWGSDPNYGAISPDWSNIWDTVQRQVKEYYHGGPLTTGINDKLKANLARRGMSDQPAADYLLMASGADEANKMKDIATSMGEQKSALSEQGRRDWLSSLMTLSQQKPQGQWNTTIKEDKTSNILDAISGISSSVAQYGMYDNWLKKLKSQSQIPEQTVSPFSSSPSWLDTSRWR